MSSLSLSPLPSVDVTTTSLDLIADKKVEIERGEEDAYNAAQVVLDEKMAPKFFTAFSLGDSKMIIHGNPIIMSIKSKFFANILKDLTQEENVDNIWLAKELSVETQIEAFLSVWLHINAIPQDKYYLDFEPRDAKDSKGLEKKVTNLLDIWNWLRYFDVRLNNKAFNLYIVTLCEWIVKLIINLNPEIGLARVKKFPEQLKSTIQDLDEQLRAMAAEDDYYKEDSINLDANRLFASILRGGVFYSDLTLFPKTQVYLFFGYLNVNGLKELERGKQINADKWKSLGPLPYPKYYELYWPKVYYEAKDWKDNTRLWDSLGPISEIDFLGTYATPEGSYHPRTAITNFPQDYPFIALKVKRMEEALETTVV